MKQAGRPTRHDMVKIAVYMEHRGFSWQEWRTMNRLGNSSKAIREYIMDYIDDVLDMWDGLKPSNGRTCCEIAFIAANCACLKSYREMGFPAESWLDKILESPESWTKEEAEQAEKIYLNRHSDPARVTHKLEVALEREARLILFYTAHYVCWMYDYSFPAEKRGGLDKWIKMSFHA